MKKTVSMMMAATCLSACLAGCGGGGSTAPSSTDAPKEGQSTAAVTKGSQSAEALPELKGPGNVTLKRMGYSVTFDPNTDIAAGVIKESTGYDVEYFTLPAENADQKLVLEVAGGVDYDIIQCAPSQFQMLMSQGALMPLNDLLEAYGQDILNGVSEDSWRACSDKDGNIYGIPYKYPYAQEIDSFMVCRWDLMQAAGIDTVPATIDELYDCLIRLKEYYGEEYIIFSGPLRVSSEGNMNWVFPKVIASAFGIYNDWMVDENGKVYYMTEAEGFDEMVDFLAKCNREGLLDPDWAVNTNTTVNEKFAGGRSIITHATRAGQGDTIPALFETQGIGYEDLRYISALSGPDGTCKYMRTEAINHIAVILRSSKNAADAVNWINLKQKDQLNINIGVEGIHFTYDTDGSIKPINPIFAEERGNSYWYNDSTNEEEFAFEWPSRVRKSEPQWSAFENVTLYANEHTPEIFVNNDFAFIPGTESYSKYNKALFNSLNDYILQIMAGTKSLDDLPTFKSDWSANGGDAVQTELQEWYTGFYK